MKMIITTDLNKNEWVVDSKERFELVVDFLTKMGQKIYCKCSDDEVEKILKSL